MDLEAEATIARVYCKFQNRKWPIIKPKVIPYKPDNKKTIVLSHIKPPKMKKPIIKLKEHFLREIAKKGFDPSYADRLHEKSFKKYAEFCNEFNSSDSKSDSDSSTSSNCSCGSTSSTCGCRDYSERGFPTYVCSSCRWR